MKSFSPSGVPAEQALMLQAAGEEIAKDPLALFTDLQWFLFEAQDAVFFTAFSRKSFDAATLGEIVSQMVGLAPQLSQGYAGALPGRTLPGQVVEAITQLDVVDSFEGYPDKWIGRSPDIFAAKDLPLFRVQAAVLRNGPDADGRASIVQVRASHALLEGADSALLTRGQSAARNLKLGKVRKVGALARIGSFFHAQFLAWTYIITANLLAPAEKPWGYKTLAIKRHRLRALANRLGVRQRSLYFALVTFALNGEGPDKHIQKRAIGATYTLLGDNTRNELEDGYLRFRALQAKFRVDDDFLEFVRHVDDTVAKVETQDLTKFLTLMGVMMRTLRGLHRMWDGLPGKRFWRFNLGIDIALTLVPPHHPYGGLTEGIVEPIYCGAWHPAQNICTFCPGREYITLNFSMEQRHIDNVHKIMPLLERLEGMDLPEPKQRTAAVEA